ncbi:hypothetical protein BDP67DRAFT_258034 [Colletotrichum lupini]|nr:hypothetical protein BDP67DRAFT_258034 [Colletotrichum lupini]
MEFLFQSSIPPPLTPLGAKQLSSQQRTTLSLRSARTPAEPHRMTELHSQIFASNFAISSRPPMPNPRPDPLSLPLYSVRRLGPQQRWTSTFHSPAQRNYSLQALYSSSFWSINLRHIDTHRPKNQKLALFEGRSWKAEMGHSTGRRSSKQPSRSSLTHTDSSHTSLFDVFILCALLRNRATTDSWTSRLSFLLLLLCISSSTRNVRQASPRTPITDDGFRGRDNLET